MTQDDSDRMLDAIATDVEALAYVAVSLPLPSGAGGDLVGNLAPWLSESDRHRFNEMSSERTATAFVVTRALLRRVLDRIIGIPAKEIEFAAAERGKPSLVSRPEKPLHFNVSHSRTQALIGLSRIGDVGVDVETIGNYRDAVARRSTSEAEYAMLQQVSDGDRPGAFFRLWTIKEACAKATGHGIGVGMNKVSATFEGTGRWGEFEWASIDLGPGLAAAIAVKVPAGGAVRLDGVTHEAKIDWLMSDG